MIKKVRLPIATLTSESTPPPCVDAAPAAAHPEALNDAIDPNDAAILRKAIAQHRETMWRTGCTPRPADLVLYQSSKV